MGKTPELREVVRQERWGFVSRRKVGHFKVCRKVRIEFTVKESFSQGLWENWFDQEGYEDGLWKRVVMHSVIPS